MLELLVVLLCRIGSPWRRAREFLGEDLDRREPVQVLGAARAFCGFGLVVYQSLPYRSFGDVSEDALSKMIKSAVVGILLALVIVLGVLVAGRADKRREMLVNRGRPLVFLARVAVTVVLPGYLLLSRAVLRLPGFLDTLLPAPLMIPVLIAVAFGMAWWMVYAIFGMFYALRCSFMIGSLNALLAPVVTASIATVFTALDVIEFDTKGLPAATWWTINLTGFLTTAGLAVIEYVLLFRRGNRLTRLSPEREHDLLLAAGERAADLRACGDHRQARAVGSETLDRCRRVLGDDHPDTLATAGDLVADLDALGEVEEARRLRAWADRQRHGARADGPPPGPPA